MVVPVLLFICTRYRNNTTSALLLETVKNKRQGSPRENSRGNFPVLYVGPGTRLNTVIFGQTVYRRRRYRQKSKNRQPFKKYRHFAAPP